LWWKLTPLALSKPLILMPICESWVSLWLNTQYLHVGKSNRKGQFTRRDFEQCQSQLGEVLFEFYFLLAFQEMGSCFFNILQIAERFLYNLSQAGQAPSTS